MQTPRNQLGIANEFISHPPMSNNSKVARLFQMDEEIVKVSSVQFAMATVIAEAEALDPATLDEVRH